LHSLSHKRSHTLTLSPTHTLTPPHPHTFYDRSMTTSRGCQCWSKARE
jgi:hypothetical protein